MADAGRVISLRSGSAHVLVSTAGGAILAAEASGQPLLARAESPGIATRQHGREACFPLVPFGGRIEGNRFRHAGETFLLAPNTDDPLVLHGDGWLSQWCVEQASGDSLLISLDHGPAEGTPYVYRAEQTIVLFQDGLRVTLSVTNRGAAALPFGLGFHPYFPAGPACRVEFQADAVFGERLGFLPGTRRAIEFPLDFRAPQPVPAGWIHNCFDGWSGQARLYPESGRAILLTADPLLDRLMVYRPSGDAGFLCLEPMSHKPNAHDDPGGGLVVLAEGETLSAWMEIRLTPT